MAAVTMCAVATAMAVAAPAPPEPDPLRPAAGASELVVHQVTVRQRTIIRVTPQPRPGQKRAPTVTEKPFGKCVPVAELGTVIVSGAATLDLVTRSSGRIRVYLGDGCMAQHYYSGFYYARPADGKLCVGRDVLHSRSGMKCDIDRLVSLATP